MLRGAACCRACIRIVDYVKHYSNAASLIYQSNVLFQLQLQTLHVRKAAVTLVQDLENASLYNNVWLELMGCKA